MTSSIEFVPDPTWPSPSFLSDQENKQSFSNAREQTRNLVQWLVRVANSYVANGPIEDRLALNFHPEASFVTKTFAHDIAIELRLPTLKLQFQELGKRVPHVLDPEERSPAEVEAWILVELLHRGLDRDKFSKSLPYTIPNLMSGDAEDYSPRACASGLSQLTAWFCAAASVLSNCGHILCLPQTLSLVAAPEHGGPVAGFCPGDADLDEPYFFVPAKSRRNHSILTATALANEKDPATAALQFIKALGDLMRA